MTNYTKEDIARLVPEERLAKLCELILVVCNEKSGDRVEATLAHALLSTRAKLEVAMQKLEDMAEFDWQGGPVNGCAEALDKIRALDEPKGDDDE